MKNKLFIFLIIFHLILLTGPGYSQEFEMPGYIYDITTGDIDADGSNDILVSCPYSDTITILFNDGAGNFEINYYNRPCGFILCGIIDIDNLIDLITRDGYNLYYIKNLGNRLLSENTILLQIQGTYSATSIIDFDNDSLNDIVYTHTSGEYWGIFKNNGVLTFTNEIIQSGSSTTNPAVGFITDDLLPDVVLTYSAFNRSSVNVNNDNFNFTEVVLEQTFIGEAFVLNIDNQGTEDFAFVDYYTKTIPLYKFIGNDQFELQSNFYAEGTYPISSFLPADFNQDGYDDFAITRGDWWNSSDSLYIYFNDQNWSFYLNQIYYVGYLGFFNLKSADLNGDSYPDLYMSGAGTNGNKTLKLLWNDGTGYFSYENPVFINDRNPITDELKVFPNPFHDFITIEIPQINTSQSSVSIYDMYGRSVKKFAPDKVDAARHISIKWDGIDENMDPCPEGIYFLSVRSNSYKISKKVIKY